MQSRVLLKLSTFLVEFSVLRSSVQCKYVIQRDSRKDSAVEDSDSVNMGFFRQCCQYYCVYLLCSAKTCSWKFSFCILVLGKMQEMEVNYQKTLLYVATTLFITIAVVFNGNHRIIECSMIGQ